MAGNRRLARLHRIRQARSSLSGGRAPRVPRRYRKRARLWHRRRGAPRGARHRTHHGRSSRLGLDWNALSARQRGARAQKYWRSTLSEKNPTCVRPTHISKRNRDGGPVPRDAHGGSERKVKVAHRQAHDRIQSRLLVVPEIFSAKSRGTQFLRLGATAITSPKIAAGRHNKGRGHQTNREDLSAMKNVFLRLLSPVPYDELLTASISQFGRQRASFNNGNKGLMVEAWWVRIQ